MAVYVDDMRAPFGRMVMCHMVADTDDELHAMADRIGVARRWHQKAGTHRSHYDICLAKRALAVAAGALEVTQREVARIARRKRADARGKCRDCGHLLAPGRRFWCTRCVHDHIGED